MIIFNTKALRLLTLGSKDITGIVLFPFIILHENQKQSPNLSITLNHERIHLRQQMELLILPFIVIYCLSYLFLRIRGKSHTGAYMNIVFEKEAYANMNDLSYLKCRRFLACFRSS